MKAHSTNAGGFTLIETSIAMVVMMVVGLGATSLFLYSIRSNSGGEDRSQALAIAQQRLELLRELPYNHTDLAVGVSTSTVVLQDMTSGTTPGSATAQSFGGATASSYDPSVTPSKPGKGSPKPTPTPDATPTPGGGGSTGGGGAGDDTYNVSINVEGLPAGSTAPTQKRITITVTPVNGHGADSWVNQNPVVITQYRSSPATGPFRL